MCASRRGMFRQWLYVRTGNRSRASGAWRGQCDTLDGSSNIFFVRGTRTHRKLALCQIRASVSCFLLFNRPALNLAQVRECARIWSPRLPAGHEDEGGDQITHDAAHVVRRVSPEGGTGLPGWATKANARCRGKVGMVCYGLVDI